MQNENEQLKSGPGQRREERTSLPSSPTPLPEAPNTLQASQSVQQRLVLSNQQFNEIDAFDKTDVVNSSTIVGTPVIDRTVRVEKPAQVRDGFTVTRLTAPWYYRQTRSFWIMLASMIAIIALLFGGLTAFLLHDHPSPVTSHFQSSTVTSTPTSTVVITPRPTATPSPRVTPLPASQTVENITVTPGGLRLPQDCQPDNGYRCTVTLTANEHANKHTKWSAVIQSKNTTFQPDQGNLSQGQSTQIIIFIRQQCPYHATLDITIRNQHLLVPLTC